MGNGLCAGVGQTVLYCMLLSSSFVYSSISTTFASNLVVNLILQLNRLYYLTLSAYPIPCHEPLSSQSHNNITAAHSPHLASTDNARASASPSITLLSPPPTLSQGNGQVNQESLGPPHNPHRRSLYVVSSIPYISPPQQQQPPFNQSLTLLTFPSHNRPNRRLNLRLLLAKDVLGLPDHEPRPGRPPRPHPPNHKPPPRSPRPLLGMAPPTLHHGRHLHPFIP